MFSLECPGLRRSEFVPAGAQKICGKLLASYYYYYVRFVMCDLVFSSSFFNQLVKLWSCHPLFLFSLSLLHSWRWLSLCGNSLSALYCPLVFWCCYCWVWGLVSTWFLGSWSLSRMDLVPRGRHVSLLIFQLSQGHVNMLWKSAALFYFLGPRLPVALITDGIFSIRVWVWS